MDFKRRKQQILIKLDIDLKHSPHILLIHHHRRRRRRRFVFVGDFLEWVKLKSKCTKSSIKFLPIYYEYVFVENHPIGDEIYADKCKVALRNIPHLRYNV